MAPEAVLLYHASARFADIDCLGFIPQSKNCGMPQAVIGFEVVLPDEAVMRYMARIAISDALVRTV